LRFLENALNAPLAFPQLFHVVDCVGRAFVISQDHHPLWEHRHRCNVDRQLEPVVFCRENLRACAVCDMLANLAPVAAFRNREQEPLRSKRRGFFYFVANNSAISPLVCHAY
jgi:hypothetical protein